MKSDPDSLILPLFFGASIFIIGRCRFPLDPAQTKRRVNVTENQTESSQPPRFRRHAAAQKAERCECVSV